MRVGVVFPQTESGADPGAIREFAQAVEAMGYRHLSAYDHVAGGTRERLQHLPWAPYDVESVFHEVFVLLAWVAAMTQRLELVTSVLVLPQRETVLVAKQAAALDILSGGRVRLGIGVGWNDVEYEALQAGFRNRGARQAEQVQVLRRLWTEPVVDFDGRYHHLHGVGIRPLPVQRPIPIWFGGTSDQTYDRMVRLGDGYMPNPAPNRLEALRPKLDDLRARLRQAGRDPAEFGLEPRLNLKDPPEVRASVLAFWREQGASHLALNTMGMGLPDLPAHLRVLEAARAEVGLT